MKDLGLVKKILGIEIRRDRITEKLYLSKKNYFLKVIKHFGMWDSKPVGAPLENHLKLIINLSPHTIEEKKYVSQVLYASAIGSLVYGMVYI